MQEKGSSHQVQALIGKLPTQELGTHLPAWPAEPHPKRLVLLLEPVGRRSVEAVGCRHFGPKDRLSADCNCSLNFHPTLASVLMCYMIIHV